MDEPSQPTTRVIRTMPADAEARLNAAVGRLRSSGADSQFPQTPLGEFWDPTLPRSPFEEALTIQQVCSIKLEPIVRKRSFSEAKLEALLVAMARCAQVAGDLPRQQGPSLGAVAQTQSSLALRVAQPIVLPESVQTPWNPLLEPWRT
ncbi:MAG: hypothetical protein EB127_24905, partial [Alphaproteobacteria bacterium]|nr:hypothetical protein [Alphaproteobacteria bacterium]